MRANIEQREAMLSLIEQWQQSGISQKGFYKQHNIPAHVFYYWLKCYRKQQAGSDQSIASNSFVQLQPSLAPLAGNIELQLTNGNRIIFHQPVGVDYLKALISRAYASFIINSQVLFIPNCGRHEKRIRQFIRYRNIRDEPAGA